MERVEESVDLFGLTSRLIYPYPYRRVHKTLQYRVAVGQMLSRLLLYEFVDLQSRLYSRARSNRVPHAVRRHLVTLHKVYEEGLIEI